MFDRASLQAQVDASASFPHAVSVISPVAFELRPQGFGEGSASYAIVVQRIAFLLRVELRTDWMAVALRAAVTAGARTRPQRLDRLAADLRAAGWDASVIINPDEFSISAAMPPGWLDEQSQTDACVSAALIISEYVLDHLIVSQEAGESRPATVRPTPESTESEPWLYDPNERDKSTRQHALLENWLIGELRTLGYEPLDAASEPYFDIAWRLPTKFVVCEVKSSMRSEVHQVRLGLGQVLHYRYVLEKAIGPPIVPLLLVEGPMTHADLQEACMSAGVRVFWPDVWADLTAELGM